jgi:hypothetical protein
MDLIPPPALLLQGRFRFPNVIIFPPELRNAIPEYGSRALVFDSVTGAYGLQWFGYERGIGEKQIRADFVVHETGKLNGTFNLQVFLDIPTARALGQLLIGLADQAEAAG